MSLSVWGIGLCVSVASASGHVAGHRVCDGLGGWVGGGGGVDGLAGDCVRGFGGSPGCVA